MIYLAVSRKANKEDYNYNYNYSTITIETEVSVWMHYFDIFHCDNYKCLSEKQSSVDLQSHFIFFKVIL